MVRVVASLLLVTSLGCATRQGAARSTALASLGALTVGAAIGAGCHEEGAGGCDSGASLALAAPFVVASVLLAGTTVAIHATSGDDR